MSVVAVKIYPNKIVIGADSYIGFGCDTQLIDQDVKLFQHNGLVVGVVGYAKDASLFKLYSRDRKPARDDEDAMIEFISDFISWAEKKIKDFSLKSDFIIIHKHKVWFINDSFYLKQIKDYRAMGAGQDMAQAILHSGGDIQKALSIACELSQYCEKPLNIIEIKK